MSSVPNNGTQSANNTPKQVAEEFLRLLYAPALAALDAVKKAGRVVLFYLPSRLAFASRNLDDIAKVAIERTQDGQSVYFHMQVHELPGGEGPSRGRCDTVRAAIALAVDIDAVGPGRKGPGRRLCPSVEAAVSLVDDFDTRFAPLRCGLVIGSGYGCYPMLLFADPFITEDDADRQRLEHLSRRFHSAFVSIAAEHGCSDAVEYCDLAKVLRMPGTVNWKDGGNPQPVRILRESPARFDINDIERLLPEIKEGTRTTNNSAPVGDKIPKG